MFASLKTVLVNWKTTALGVVAVCASAGMFFTGTADALGAILDGDPATVANWSQAGLGLSGIAAGFAAIFSRDADKTSEASAAK